MTEWTSGYNSEISYTYLYFSETSPSWLNLSATVSGTAHPERDWRYLDLGCGNGVGLIIHAALNPQHEFVGVDFNPEHVAHGTMLAAAAGLTNIKFYEADFVDLANDWPSELGGFDYIVAHGILSWVAPEIRKALIKTIDRASNPGALIYVSYNCMPGRVSDLPIQHLFKLWQKTGAKQPNEAIRLGINRFEALAGAGAGMMSTLPNLSASVEGMKTKDPAYLVHEYLHDSWQSLWFDQVAELMTTAKLTYTGSAEIADRYVSAVLTPEQQEIVKEHENPIVREVMVDVIVNRYFRKDVFVRGAVPKWASSENTKLEKCLFCLGPKTPVGKVKFDVLGRTLLGRPNVFERYFKALEDGPKTISELMQTAGKPSKSFEDVKKALMYLLQSKFVSLYSPAEDPNIVKNLNKTLATKMAGGAPYLNLVSSVTGTVYSPTYNEMFMFSETQTRKGPYDAKQLATELVAHHKERNTMLVNQGLATGDLEAEMSIAIKLATEFLNVRLPQWKHQGVF